MTLAGRRVLVTGACGGLGRSFARGMGAEGARVFVTDLEAGAVAALVAELRAAGVEADGRAGSVVDLNPELARDADRSSRETKTRYLQHRNQLARLRRGDAGGGRLPHRSRGKPAPRGAPARA